MSCFLFDYHCTDEWNNFIHRMNTSEEEIKVSESDELIEELRLWASYRGQTLTRTGSLSPSLSLSHTHSPLCICAHAISSAYIFTINFIHSYVLA